MNGSVIRSKIRVPAVAEAVIRRGRVVEALERAAEGRRVLQVVAPPGSGKTTAVVQLLASRPGPRAWLSLGAAEGSPGRLVTYLAAAVEEEIDPGAAGRTQGMLVRGVPPADCAALLAERLPAGATLVIDDLHLIESRPPAQIVLQALLDAIAPDALVVLVSRRLVHLNLSRAILTGRSGMVSGDELSFTEPEVEELLTAHGVEATPEVVSACGGWAAGIVFGALRESRPPTGPLVSDDPFFAYLGAEVLDPLPPDVRRAVVRSAVLHTVDAGGLEALGGACGETMLRRIRSHHLPVTLEPEGLRYHPRFREFLLSRLRDEPDEMRTMLVRYARRLMALGHPEEAADHFIEAGEPSEAAAAVEAATTAVLMRGDWSKVLGWCDAIGEEALSRRASLRGCQLRGIIAGRRSEGPSFVEALRSSGEFERLVAEDPEAATTAVFGLHLCTDWASLLPLLPADETSPGVRAMRYVLQVGSGRVAPREWSPQPRDLRSPSIGLLTCGLYLQGHFAEVERTAGLVADRSVSERPNTGLYVISTLRKRGRLAEARAAFDASRDAGWASGFGDFWRHLEAELVFAEGDRERGLELARDARAFTRSLGHQPADRAIFAVTEGKMLVRLGRVDEAAELLETASAWCREHGLPCFGEWADTWLAAALLARGDAPDRAVDLLEGAIAGMMAASRRLELSAAHAFLAEARRRTGDAPGYIAAAEAARAVAAEMGMPVPVLDALPGAPEVSARGLPADEPAPVRVVLGTLGRPRAVLDGVEREIAPLRALEVAASVARAGAAGLSRAALAAEVMDDSADAANYLRQVIHRLRRLAPEGVELVSDNGRLRWSPRGAVVTEDQLLTAALARARRGIGDARRAALAEALELADRGPLIVSLQNPEATRLRDELSAAVADARLEHAEMLLGAGRPDEALDCARASVIAEPLREDGWRLVMRAAAAARGPSAAVPVYAECARALGAVDLRPSRETSRLLDHLRDPALGAVAGRA